MKVPQLHTLRVAALTILNEIDMHFVISESAYDSLYTIIFGSRSRKQLECLIRALRADLSSRYAFEGRVEERL